MGDVKVEAGDLTAWEPDPHIDLETAVFRYRGMTIPGKRLAELLGLAPGECGTAVAPADAPADA